MEMEKANPPDLTGEVAMPFKNPKSLEAFYNEVFGQPRLIKKDGKWLIKSLDSDSFKEIQGDKEVAETILHPDETTSGHGTYIGYIATRDFEAVKEKLKEFRCHQLTRPDEEYHKHLNTRAAFFYDRAGNLFNLIEHIED